MESKSKTSKQTLTGTVVSNRMTNTVVVEVRTHHRHSKYHKAYSISKRYKVHAEGEYVVGDKVQIESTRPLSGSKRFKVVKKV